MFYSLKQATVMYKGVRTLCSYKELARHLAVYQERKGWKETKERVTEVPLVVGALCIMLVRKLDTAHRIV